MFAVKRLQIIKLVFLIVYVKLVSLPTLTSEVDAHVHPQDIEYDFINFLSSLGHLAIAFIVPYFLIEICGPVFFALKYRFRLQRKKKTESGQ